MGRRIPGLLVAAPSSGCGKTTVTLALMAALRRKGLRVAPFKVGPDFIDPGHHALACDRTSRNLDAWMCPEGAVRTIFDKGCEGADVAVVEGVMGLFDGVSGKSAVGSSAEIARLLDLPVVLVVDARSQARSAAALVTGFARFDPRLRVAGVVCNRVGSDRHAQILRDALDATPGLPPLLGCLPRDEGLALPERHLGLVTASDAARDDAFFGRLADWVEEHVDLEGVLSLSSPPRAGTSDERVSQERREGDVRIAVARDEAFCFCYGENLERLEEAGATLLFFSPLREERLPEGADGLYLPGGYPELHAERLAANRSLLDEIRLRAEGGFPVYAECGGFMLLAEEIDGQKMAGVFPAKARMLPRRRALGYREVTFTQETVLGGAGTVARGHEFHYSEMEIPDGIERAYAVTRGSGEPLGAEGYKVGNVLGSYVHLHFASNPELARNFVSACKVFTHRGCAP